MGKNRRDHECDAAQEVDDDDPPGDAAVFPAKQPVAELDHRRTTRDEKQNRANIVGNPDNHLVAQQADAGKRSESGQVKSQRAEELGKGSPEVDAPRLPADIAPPRRARVLPALSMASGALIDWEYWLYPAAVKKMEPMK